MPLWLHKLTNFSQRKQRWKGSFINISSSIVVAIIMLSTTAIMRNSISNNNNNNHRFVSSFCRAWVLPSSAGRHQRHQRITFTTTSRWWIHQHGKANVQVGTTSAARATSAVDTIETAFAPLSTITNTNAAAAAPKKFTPFPFAYHAELVLRVDALTNLGVGVCRTNVSKTMITNSIDDHHPNTTTAERSSKRRRQRNKAKKDNANHTNTYHNHDNEQDIDNDTTILTTTTTTELSSPPQTVTEDENIANNNNNNNSRSWVVMVPRVIPGELVLVRIYRNHATYSEADLLQVLEPSPHRVITSSSSSDTTATTATTICPLFEKGCGGCQYQHMTMTQQRLYKQIHVRDALIRIGKLDRDMVHALVLPTLGTDQVWNYRTKLTPHYPALPANFTIPSSTTITKTTVTTNDEEGDDNPNNDDITSLPLQQQQQQLLPPIGFQHVGNQHVILDVPTCPIATPAINQHLTKLRHDLHQSLLEHGKWPTKWGATLLLRQGDADGPVTTEYKEYVTCHVHQLQFRFQAGNFFQNNPYMVPVMVDQVIQAATAPSRYNSHHHQQHDTIIDNMDNDNDSDSPIDNNNKMTHLIDCYCGSGLFAVSCAPHLQRCVGIEVNGQAVVEAKANAALNHLTTDRCDFYAASAERIFFAMGVQDFPRRTTSVLMDPPRKGCSPEFLQQLLDFAPQRIIYVSCDPATQARDVRYLLSHNSPRNVNGAGAGDGGGSGSGEEEPLLHYEITKVQPMDLFPQTRHIECIVVLEAKPRS